MVHRINPVSPVELCDPRDYLLRIVPGCDYFYSSDNQFTLNPGYAGILQTIRMSMCTGYPNAILPECKKKT